jgi:hypothetical protein
MRLAALSLLALGICNAQTMRELDRRFVHAIDQAERPALEKLLDPVFTWIDAGGTLRTRTQVLQDLPKPAIPGAAAGRLRTYSYGALGDIQADLGRAHILRVWVKRDGSWKIILYQEVQSLAAPSAFTPSASQECENPCQSIPLQPKSEAERQVVAAYSKLETAAMAHNSAAFARVTGGEFVAVSSNSAKISTKRARMEDFDHAKNGGVAPTPLTSGHLAQFGDAVLMISLHTPTRGKPLRVTRVWVKQNGNWVEMLSYQTSIAAPLLH